MSNTTSNGRKKSLRALVVAGNKNGLAGTSRILDKKYSLHFETTPNFCGSIKKKAGWFFFLLLLFLPFLVDLLDFYPESDKDQIFFLQCHPLVTLVGRTSKGNNHQFKNFLNVKQILLFSTLGKFMQNIMGNLHTNLVV